MQSTALRGTWTPRVTTVQTATVPQAAPRRKRPSPAAVRNSATLEDAVKDHVKGASKRAKLGSSDLEVSSESSIGLLRVNCV